MYNFIFYFVLLKPPASNAFLSIAGELIQCVFVITNPEAEL